MSFTPESPKARRMSIRNRAILASVATVAAGTYTGINLASNHPKDPVQVIAKNINHTIVEPTCTGVTLQRVDQDDFDVVPTLTGSFVNSMHVVSYLALTAEAEPAQPAQAINISGGTAETAQIGEGVIAALQANIQTPVTLAIDDYQRVIPVLPSNYRYESIQGVPTVSCPPADLGYLALQYFDSLNGTHNALPACVSDANIEDTSVLCQN